MRMDILPSGDTSPIDREVMDGNRIRLLPAAVWRQFPHDLLRQWCNDRARYGVVTQELVDFIKPIINGRRALEVAAGMGDLGFHLGVPMTDSHLQERPMMRKYYETFKQTLTTPPADVRKRGAIQAIRDYRPQVVIASWLTQKFAAGDEERGIGSNIYGPDEREIIWACDTYIHIGNAHVHGDKRVLALPHETHRPDWMVSRAANQFANCIYIWESYRRWA